MKKTTVIFVAMVAAVGLIASSGVADGTIKDACGIAPDAFKAWRETSLARRSGWYAKAEKTVPKLYCREVKPVGLVKVQLDAAATGNDLADVGGRDTGDTRMFFRTSSSVPYPYSSDVSSSGFVWLLSTYVEPLTSNCMSYSSESAMRSNGVAVTVAAKMNPLSAFMTFSQFC